MRPFLVNWAKMDEADVDAIASSTIDQEKLSALYHTEFAALKVIWREFPESQWEITRAVARDMIEWKDLREALVVFKKAFRKLKSRKKRVENQSPEVPAVGVD